MRISKAVIIKVINLRESNQGFSELKIFVQGHKSS